MNNENKLSEILTNNEDSIIESNSISQQNRIDKEELKQRCQNHFTRNEKFLFENLSKISNFQIRYNQSKLYFGQYFNNQKQGIGVLLMGDGKFYEGEWQNNRKHGFGYEQFTNQSYYYGKFVNNKPHGYGCYIWGNGELYEGEWFNGKKHGQGTWIGLQGDKYIGQWNQGKPHGKGIHQWINGDKYEGEFSDSLKQGQGIEYFSNGDKFQGEYLNGKPEGSGTYTWIDGSSFQGQFTVLNNQFFFFFYENLQGQFKNGLRCGYGIYCSQKYSYKGQYINDKKCGQGVYIYQNGDEFEGYFYNDQKDGVGILRKSDGSQVQQIWKMGKLASNSQQKERNINSIEQKIINYNSKYIKRQQQQNIEFLTQHINNTEQQKPRSRSKSTIQQYEQQNTISQDILQSFNNNNRNIIFHSSKQDQQSQTESRSRMMRYDSLSIENSISDVQNRGQIKLNQFFIRSLSSNRRDNNKKEQNISRLRSSYETNKQKYQIRLSNTQEDKQHYSSDASTNTNTMNNFIQKPIKINQQFFDLNHNLMNQTLNEQEKYNKSMIKFKQFSRVLGNNSQKSTLKRFDLKRQNDLNDYQQKSLPKKINKSIRNRSISARSNIVEIYGKKN